MDNKWFAWVWFTFAFFMIAIIYFLSGCATTGLQTLPNSVPYEATTRASMGFEANGQAFVGVGVLPRLSRQTIKFRLPRDTIKLMISSCNREEFTGYPNSDKSFEWIYIPVMYVENVDTCLVSAVAITKQGEMQKAIIDFRTGESLTALLKCNGTSIQQTGAGICQAREGLIQAIDFSEEVVWVGDSSCNEMSEGIGVDSFTFSMTTGFCIYSFANKKGEIFRLTTYGYKSIDEVK